MKYTRPELTTVATCCNQSVSRKLDTHTVIDSELYVCRLCGKEDYLSGFSDAALKDECIYCFECKADTMQFFIGGDDASIKTKCNECSNVNEFDLTETYCEHCKDYTKQTHYNEYKECNVCCTKSERFPAVWGWIDD